MNRLHLNCIVLAIYYIPRFWIIQCNARSLYLYGIRGLANISNGFIRVRQCYSSRQTKVSVILPIDVIRVLPKLLFTQKTFPY